MYPWVVYLQILYPPVLNSWLLRANWILFVCFLVLSPFSPKPGSEEGLTTSQAQGGSVPSRLL